MIELNDTNGASHYTAEITKQIMKEFEGDLFGAEFGIAYGGGVERIGKLWGSRGTVWGFDTFEGHPKEIGELCEHSKEAGGVSSFAATCMDGWYSNSDYGTERLAYDYQRKKLDEQGLTNVTLVKGIINEKTDVSFIPKLHYCFIDLDFPLSIWQAYNLVKYKIVKGGYLCLHDVIPEHHIHGCYYRYKQILADGMFEVYNEFDNHLLAILKK